MPSSWLSRPAVVLLALFCSVLCWRRAAGPFGAPPARELFGARFGKRLRVEVEQPPREDARGLWLEGKLLDYPGQRARLRFKTLSLFDAPRPGETVALDCVVKRPRTGKNPGDFDERRHLEDRGVQWTADCAVPVERAPPRRPDERLRAAAEDLRRGLERAWRDKLSALDARLMAGLVLGYKGPLERELNRQTQDAGVIHLLVPSGAKIAFVLLIINGVCALLRAPPWARLALSFGVGGFVALAAGGEPPYVRAWLSACFVQLGQRWERDASAFQAAVYSAWLILLWDPSALFTLGFQMTFACAFVLSAAFAGRRGKARGFLSSAREHLFVTALVEAALWPMFASGFGRAAASGALANVLLVPLSLPLMAMGWVMPVLPTGRAAAWGLAGFRKVCEVFSTLPGAAVELSPMTGLQTAALYLSLTAFFVRFAAKGRMILLGIAAGLVLGEGAWARWRAPPLSVLYLSRPGFRAAALVRRGVEAPRLVTDRASEALQRKASRAYGWGEPSEVISLRTRPNYRACEGRVCLRFDQPCFDGPSGEFCILSLLKKHAVEVSTDGSRIQIRQASDQLRRRLL